MLTLKVIIISIKEIYKNGVDWSLRIIFCGGAGEVGASCIFLEIDGKKVLFDCGIRMGGQKDCLPDLKIIQECGGLDAVFVSHAHMDHTGALPIISREYPEAKIYMTHMTKGLVRVLLYDSLKIMDRGEEEIPIYAEKHVLDMLDRVVCYSPQFTFKPFNDKNQKVTFYPAGHIAGAVMIFIEGDEGTVLYTGDVSGSEQRTVSGASMPKLRPDVLIMETTYGDKLHSNRQVEEERLIQNIREVIMRGGKILIPAFALGRAQEIILILKKAMSKKELPKFKIYVDGMVKDINRVYKMYPNYLKNELARKVLRGTDIFYDENIIAVNNVEMRNEILNLNEPFCIIASSGMLTGGPSAFYAEKLAGDEKNFIAITGYQDEEAPGREILELLENSEKDRIININGRTIPLKCGMDKYGLSAHSDKGELIGITARTTPKKMFLVHGDKEVTQSFGKWLNSETRTNIYIPVNGEGYNFSIINKRKQLSLRSSIISLKKIEKPSSDNVEELWRYLYGLYGTDRVYSVEELLEIWSGKECSCEKDILDFRDVLNTSIYFTPDLRRMFLYRPVTEDDIKNDKDSIMEFNEMLKYVDNAFPKESGLYKKGARQEEKIALLYFTFPRVARVKYDDLIKKVEYETGWKVEINNDCNLSEAESFLKSLLPENTVIKKFSYYRDEEYFLIELNEVPEDFESICQKFMDITGLQLKIKSKKNEEQVISFKEHQNEFVMEQNEAFEYIAEAFENEEHRVYKKSKKTAGSIEYIELSFISPEVGKRYTEKIERLQEEIGWNILISNNPNQNEIIKSVKNICSDFGLAIIKNPSIFTVERVVKIKVEEGITDHIKALLCEKIKYSTGYNVILV